MSISGTGRKTRRPRRTLPGGTDRRDLTPRDCSIANYDKFIPFSDTIENPLRTPPRTMEHTIPVPVWTLLLAVAAWILTNLMVWVATGKRAKSILAGAKAESQAQKEEVVAHFDEELAKLDAGAVQDKIDALDVALGAKFEEWDAAMAAMPTTIAKSLGSMKGVEMKALYGAAVEGEEELETYMAENMDASEVAMARVAAIEPGDDWKGKHPLGAMLIEWGKAEMRARMDSARNVVTLNPMGKKPRGFR